MGRRRPALFLVLQISVILLPTIGLIMAGPVLDKLAGTSPVGTLAFLAVGMTLGTSLIVITVVKSFSAPSRSQQSHGDGQAAAEQDSAPHRAAALPDQGE